MLCTWCVLSFKYSITLWVILWQLCKTCCNSVITACKHTCVVTHGGEIYLFISTLNSNLAPSISAHSDHINWIMACGWAFLKFDKDNSYWAMNKAASRTTSKMWCWRTERYLASCNPYKWLLMSEAFLQCRAALLLSALWLWLRQSCRLSPKYRSARLGVNTDACAKSTKGLTFLPLLPPGISWEEVVYVCSRVLVWLCACL